MAATESASTAFTYTFMVVDRLAWRRIAWIVLSCTPYIPADPHDRL